jgi:hypothetical protein
MNTKEIEILLEKYFEGKTSIAEENALRRFFQSGNIPKHLQDYEPLFRFFTGEKEILADIQLEEKVIRRFRSDKTTGLDGRRRKLWVLTGIAAAFLILFTVIERAGFFLSPEPEMPQYTYSQQEIDQAFQSTALALAYISGKFNQATDPLNTMSKITTAGAFTVELGKFETGITQMNQGFDLINDGSDQFSNLSKFNLLINPITQ